MIKLGTKFMNTQKVSDLFAEITTIFVIITCWNVSSEQIFHVIHSTSQ